uniref:BTB domain-containing protein n=1 Tax=Glossina morsitans morsitans TaxID=37546 RepID=A0ABK9MIH6_GLOMM
MDQSNLTTPVSPDTCTTSSSSSTTSSAPQYSEDIRRPLHGLDLLSRKGSGSSTKTCEVNLGDEERDTFSPVSSNDSSSDPDNILNNCNGDACSSSTANNTTTALVPNKDNKQLEGLLPPLKLKLSSSLVNNMHPTPSKEEKQRQNEEIVILETSSISSETGSWESVFPHANASVTTATANSVSQMPSMDPHNMDLSNFCVGFMQKEPLLAVAGKLDASDRFHEEPTSSGTNLLTEPDLEPLNRERTYSAGAPVTADTSSLFKGHSSNCLNRELLIETKGDNPLTNSQTSNCFIDASSLCDEDEILPFSSKKNHSQIEQFKIQQKATGNANGDLNSPTKQLETFHKSFARCKVKSAKEDMLTPKEEIRPKSSSSCSSEEGESSKNRNNSGGDSASNLSDEEKLWKRDHAAYSQNTRELIDEGKSLLKQPVLRDNLLLANDEVTEPSVSLAHDLDSSDSSDMVRLRREQERKIPFSFQASPHFSGLPSLASKLIHSNQPPPSLANPPNGTHHNDLSYTTDYSSSSPAPSLVWSEHEHRSGNHQRLGLVEDYEVQQKKTCSLQPDTPHNSIVHIELTSSNTSSIHRDCTLSSSFSHHRDSGAYCSDATDSPVPMPRTPKRTKFDEANPIISGGACISDFHVKQCESPTVRRKTDACPIVSGGFVSLDFESTRPLIDDCAEEEVEMRVKPKLRKPLSGIASWVVDMSDCQRSERRRSTSSTSSLEASQSKIRERSDSNSSHKSGCGFYVSLNEMNKKPHEDENIEEKSLKQNNIAAQMSKSYNAPTSTKFFVNLSTSEYKPKDRPLEEAKIKLPKQGQNSCTNSQKTSYSMFIDIGNGDKKLRMNGRQEAFNLAQKLTGHRKCEEAMKSSASSTETLMSKSNNFKNSIEVESNIAAESKSLDYKINVEAPITVAAIRRISQQQRNQNEANKRHSWSNNPSKDFGNIECKRSISLTNNGDTVKSKENGINSKGLMSIIDKIPIISKASSLSVDSSLSPYDEYTGSKSELSTSSGGEREEGEAVGMAGIAPANRVKKRRRDVQINETFDKSSLASITDGILSKDISPMSATDTDDLTFQQEEEQAIRETAALQQQQPAQQQTSSNSQLSVSTVNSSSSRMSNIIMETIIEAKETSSPKKNLSGLSLETLHATIEKQKMLLETVNEHAEAEKSNFVKLSDMDKPLKLEIKSPDRMSTSVGNHRQINRLYKDDNRARPHSWTMSRSIGNSFLNITSSVENMRSLSRLFPNFSKEISNSLPNDMALDNMDYLQTDLSADSSLASSISRSGMDESSLSCRQPRRLGEDLLKMFLQEIATDMIVEVHGRRIKAHKCILRSRCQYFAAMLAGNQTTGVVSLQGYSYSAVHFALCHIYSGASHPPDGISLMELAALADLLGLEGLKEVTSHALKTNYCHNFHKPCSGCIDGILQVLPVALNHALDDLYRKCLRWTCRHYLKVWPTRQFAQLPPDILARCRQQIVAYLSSETVLDTVLDCDNLLGQLASYRWGALCENLVRDILDAAYAYMADHFASLIASDSFLSLGHDRSCHIPRLEGVLLRTASSLTPDQACRTYQRITRLNTVLQAKVIQMPASLGELAKELQGLHEEELEWDAEYIRLVSSLLSAVEQCLIRQCSRAMRVTAWQRMDLDLRKKIQTLARLTEPLDIKRNKGVSKAFSFGGSTRSQNLHQVKLAIQAHSKKSVAQETQMYKATQTLESVQTTERGVQANHDVREGRVLKSNSRAHVPQHYRAISQSTVTSDRNGVNMSIKNHRRTKSEAPAATTNTTNKNSEPKKLGNMPKNKSQAAKLSEIRPRYLEPKRAHNGPVRSSTSSSIPAATKKQPYQHSSSETSRHSSPATRKHTGNKVAGIKSNTNMSLDSLASATGRAAQSKACKSSDNERYSDICVDSLAESLKSSVITNKTTSHESLTTNRLAKLKATRNEINQTTTNGQTQKPRVVNGTKPIRPTSLGAKPTKYLQQKITSTGSSPSSVTTTKSATSRLSSISSTQSGRGVYKRSVSVPGNNEPLTTKHSFLSAKSREILAKRAEKNKQQELLKRRTNEQIDEKPITKPIPAVGSVMRSASHNSVLTTNSVARNFSASNIPTRRPNTLHLKKTNGLVTTSTQKAQNNKIIARNTQHTFHQEPYQTAQAVKQKIELLIKSSTNAVNVVNDKHANVDDGQHPSMIESKLERSSTFCKETADVADINELQIIE